MNNPAGSYSRGKPKGLNRVSGGADSAGKTVKEGRVRRYLRESDSPLRLFGACAMVLVNVVRVQELHLALVALSIGKIVTALSVLLVFSTTAQQGVRPLMSFPQTRLYLGIFVLAALSVPGGVWPGMSFNYVVNVLPKMAFFYYCLVRFVHSEKDYLTLVKVFLIGVAFYALLSLFSGRERFSAGYTYDPNDIGMVMCTAFPLAYYMRKAVAGKMAKLMWLGCVWMIFIGIMSTMSRGAFIGICVIIPYCLLRDKAVGKFKSVILLCAVALMFVLFAPESYLDRVSTILNPEKDYNYTHQAGRIEVWKNGISIAIKNPFLGVGVQGFVAAEGQQHDLGAWKAAHNFLIQMAAELGFGGLILLLSLLYVCIRDVRRLQTSAYQLSSRVVDVVVGLEGAFYGFIVTAMFLSHAYSGVMLFLAAQLVILQRISSLRTGYCKENAC
ncbi:O-antigen ligase family protein [Fundidesulfovibrio putealis]|uniref:O-antigen ligase family protein n=1 Tax=Fundidesulfovibrio putealis TaxID=270496 RepID=UPI000411B7BB|nr:O-antigen ligase family protein [Fundidesulfovibrio putealis]